jgi:HAD superfamily hydrolase (TIGR01509 family)
MTRGQAVIFDMDGVIVDSEPRHELAFLQVMQELGYGQTHGLRFADYLGRSDHELWLDFVSRHKPAQSLAQLKAMKRERVLEILRRDQPLFEGLVELVEKLAPQYRLGVASGSERQIVEEILAFQDLRRFFPVVVVSSEVEHGKPAPDIFLRAAAQLGVAPADCWVIEDSKPGVSAGLAAGMKVIAITNSHPAEELGLALRVVKSYEQIEQLLLPAAGG